MNKSELTSIPGVGSNIASDLSDLGYHKVSDLKNADPQEMFDRLCQLRQCRIDRCVLYVFRCAVYYASEKKHVPELLKWWNWKNRS